MGVVITATRTAAATITTTTITLYQIRNRPKSTKLPKIIITVIPRNIPLMGETFCRKPFALGASVALYFSPLTVRLVTTMGIPIRRTGIPTMVPATTDTPTLGTTGTPTLPAHRTTDTRMGPSLLTGTRTGAAEPVPPTSRFLR